MVTSPRGSGMFSAALLACSISLICPCSAQQAVASNTVSVRVPFVGCKSDGQVGPREVPSQSDKTVQIDLKSAQKLAYYRPGSSSGVLAPRGWSCFGTYGSDGDITLVTPEPIETSDRFSAVPHITGPVIEVDHWYGGTSGRFPVARITARVFPKYKTFVDSPDVRLSLA